MAILNVNSTRMELNKLKERLITTKKGHKLLKNKADGLLIEFLKIFKYTINLRKKVTQKIKTAEHNLKLAEIKTPKQELKATLKKPIQKINTKTKKSNILGVIVPKFLACENFNTEKMPNYSFFSHSNCLDIALKQYSKIILNLIELAEKEKTLLILAKEIKKTRKKVNAIEFVIIPNLQDTIKYISLKLEENERSTIARLTRIK